ncbi:MAG: MBL fold metallo-hydrolase [Solobacterium sp.]|nr:MBL fold metallo-hydrolase [Solobacterium sp.]
MKKKKGGLSRESVFRLFLALAALLLFLGGFFRHIQYSYILLFTALAVFPYPRSRTGSILKSVLCVILLGLCWYADEKNLLPVYTDEDPITVSFIDVGQGDAALIEFPDGKVMLVDCGPLENVDQTVQFLKEKNITVIDWLFLTHPHADHVGGVRRVTGEFMVRNIVEPSFLPELISDNYYYGLIQKLADQHAINLQVTKEDSIICENANLYVKMVSPPETLQHDDLNQYSGIVLIEYGDIRFLITGDAGWPAEYAVLDTGKDLSATVLRAGHHGSYDSCAGPFLDAVNADYAVISVGAGNEFQLPNANLIKRLEEHGMRVYRTDLNGTITFTADTHRILSIQTEK